MEMHDDKVAVLLSAATAAAAAAAGNEQLRRRRRGCGSLCAVCSAVDVVDAVVGQRVFRHTQIKGI